jgi:hypothetical protein
MPAFKHILFPVDFSDRCDAVRPLVKSVAQRFRSEAHIDACHPDSGRLV